MEEGFNLAKKLQRCIVQCVSIPVSSLLHLTNTPSYRTACAAN